MAAAKRPHPYDGEFVDQALGFRFRCANGVVSGTFQFKRDTVVCSGKFLGEISKEGVLKAKATGQVEGITRENPTKKSLIPMTGEVKSNESLNQILPENEIYNKLRGDLYWSCPDASYYAGVNDWTVLRK